MEELSINIKILDRAYPMKAQAMEETYLRTAGKLINEQLNVYKTKFSIDDKQDLLAMAGLDNLITLRKQENAADANKQFKKNYRLNSAY